MKKQISGTGGQIAANDQLFQTASADFVEIKDKMFIAQTNEIYINKEDYLGKTIKYEGVFFILEADGQTNYYVIRYGPGCCPGVDNVAGFEVVWDKNYPQNNDWVEVIGVLEEYVQNGNNYIRLALTSLIVRNTRGSEYAIQ
jgi:uncharacterized membrane protein YcgQ (UPF0703/DUF1980 family)